MRIRVAVHKGERDLHPRMLRETSSGEEIFGEGVTAKGRLGTAAVRLQTERM